MNNKLRLNGKHSVTIRFGATNNDVTVDGKTLSLSRREDETEKDRLVRVDRAAADLNAMIFS